MKFLDFFRVKKKRFHLPSFLIYLLSRDYGSKRKKIVTGIYLNVYEPVNKFWNIL